MKLYPLAMDFIVLLKRVDSLTNSLNVTGAALENLSYCFSEGYRLAGLIICDNFFFFYCSSKKYKGYLSSLKLEKAEGGSLTGRCEMELSKLGFRYQCLFLMEMWVFLTLFPLNHSLKKKSWTVRNNIHKE